MAKTDTFAVNATTSLVSAIFRRRRAVSANRMVSVWFVGCSLTALFVSGLACVLSNASAPYIAGQFFLAGMAYVSLLLLGDRPFLNPLQAFVFWAYFIYGLGPSIGTIEMELRGTAEALWKQDTATGSLYIVAVGLPIYSAFARITVNWLESRGICLTFLLPHGFSFSSQRIALYFLAGFLITTSINYFGQTGDFGTLFQVSGPLGGRKYVSLLAALFSSLGILLDLATSAAMWALAAPRGAVSPSARILGILILLYRLVLALVTGWKTPFMIPLAYIIATRFSIKQRPPFFLMIATLLVFLTVVSPFVTVGRNLITTTGATDLSDTSAIYHDLLSDPLASIHRGESAGIGSLTRDLGLYGGEIAKKSGLLHGYFDINTIEWGLIQLIPRYISPDKPDMRIGNYYSREVAGPLGLASSNNELNSVGVGMPFEFVGNYGWLAGIMSFALIGVMWGLWSTALLSAEKLWCHPLTPWLVCQVTMFEATLGGMLAMFRNSVIWLPTLWIISRLLRKKG